MEFGLPLLYPLEKNGSLIHKTPLTQELSCVRGIQRRKNVIEHWTVIRENCREDEDYRPVEEDGKEDLDGNSRQQSKQGPMNKGEARHGRQESFQRVMAGSI